MLYLFGFLWLVICLVFCFFFERILGINDKDLVQGLSVLFSGVLLLATWYYIHERTKSIIYNAVNTHYDTLCRKRDQALYYDDYGNEITSGFVKELIYFVDNVVFPGCDLTMDKKLKYAQMVADAMDQVQTERPKPELPESEQELEMLAENSPDPYEFEGNCKKILEKAGWEARTTPKSGDQGVDVIAKKDDILIVVQCKFYSQPVGNKAVQEIAAGKTYYKADYAVVVTNHSYTKAAKQLAKSCGVILLNVKQLKKVDDFLE